MDLVHISAAFLQARCSYGGMGVFLPYSESLMAETISVVPSHLGNIFINYCTSDSENPWI